MSLIQTELNEKMRSILVDWLVDVHIKFKLQPETLFLAVNLIDRYLSQNIASKQKLQLLGITCMFIAAKYEEIYPPPVKDFAYVTDRAYTTKEILEMEGKVLSSLMFKLTFASAFRFLERYHLIAQLDEKGYNLARYLLELSLVEYKLQKYSPSVLACSAIYLANKLTKRELWSKDLFRNTKYDENDLKSCAKELLILFQNAPKSSLKAVNRKFSTTKYFEVAKLQSDLY